MKHNNKAILLISTNGRYGGAQKRSLTVFKKMYPDCFLIINDFFLQNLIAEKMIDKDKFSDKILTLSLVNTKQKVSGADKTVSSSGTKPARKASFKKPERNRNFIIGKLKKMRSLYRYTGLNFRILRQLNKLMSQNNISAVYTNWKGGIYSWPLRKFRKFKLIYSYNDAAVTFVNKSFKDYFETEYFAIKNSDKIDFLSEQIYHDMKSSISIKPAKAHFSPSTFIDFEKFHAEYPKQKEIIFMSRLTPIKNPILFLEAIKKLHENNFLQQNDIKVRILGEGIMLPQMKEFAKKFNLKQVNFEGFVYQTEKILRRSSVFVSIQQTENYPSQSMLEAMACENAIIASDVGETRRIVSENEGVLVNLNADEIADAIYRLFSNEEFLKEKGKNAATRVKTEHSEEKYLAYINGLFSKS